MQVLWWSPGLLCTREGGRKTSVSLGWRAENVKCIPLTSLGGTQGTRPLDRRVDRCTLRRSASRMPADLPDLVLTGGTIRAQCVVTGTGGGGLRQPPFSCCSRRTLAGLGLEVRRLRRQRLQMSLYNDPATEVVVARTTYLNLLSLSRKYKINTRTHAHTITHAC